MSKENRPPKRFKCVYCGKMFAFEVPHRCHNGNMRKRRLKFIDTELEYWKKLAQSLLESYYGKGNFFQTPDKAGDNVTLEDMKS